MSITKAKGNMYPWVSHVHNHLFGHCPHGCKYCYVQAMAKRFPAMREKYAGQLRVDMADYRVDYGSEKIRREADSMGFDRPVVFIDHLNDLFAKLVPAGWIANVVEHCNRFPQVDYVFQSKNPSRMRLCGCLFPAGSLFGTTVESDYVPRSMYDPCLFPPEPLERLLALQGWNVRKFITVEPILRMRDPIVFAREIAKCEPEFVNIGADSKGAGLDEPSADQVRILIDELNRLGVTIKRKTNLERILK